MAATSMSGFTAVAPIIEPLPDGASVVSITTSEDSDAILVTIEGVGLQLQQFSDQHTRAAITTPRSRSFMCGAVQHHGSGVVYAAMLNPPELLSWSNLEKNFKDAAIIKLQAGSPNIHSLHVSSSFNGVVVTFEDGSYQNVHDEEFKTPLKSTLGFATTTTARRGKRKMDSSNEQANVIFSELLREQKSKTTRLLNVLNTKEGVSIASYQLPSDSGPIKSSIASIVSDGPSYTTCVAACFQWPSNVLLLYSDGTLSSCDVGKGANLVESKVSNLISTPIVKIGSVNISINKHNARAILVPTSQNHVLLVANESSAQTSAQLWDTAYSTLQASASLGQGPSIAALRKGPSCTVVATQRSVIAMDISESAASGTLAGALNMLSKTQKVLSSDWAAKVASPLIGHTLEWQPVTKFKSGEDWVSCGQSREETLTGLLNKVLDEKQTSTFDLLKQAVDAYLTTYSESSNNPINTKRARVAQNGSFQPHALLMMERFLSEKRFYPAKLISRILKRHCISHQQCPGVIESALGRTHEHKSVLLAAMEHLDGIDEETAISCFETLFSRMGSDEAVTDNNSYINSFLRLVFARSWNEVELVRTLQTLGIDLALYLLQSLQWWLNHFSNENDSTSKNKLLPTITQIIDWVGYVVDAKFTALLSSTDSHALLRSINALIVSQTELCESMKDITGTKVQFISKRALPRSHAAIGAYSVELLHL